MTVKTMQLINTETIAEMLSMNKRHVADRVVNYDGFPDPYIVGGARRWELTAVMKYIENTRQKRVGRPRAVRMVT